MVTFPMRWLVPRLALSLACVLPACRGADAPVIPPSAASPSPEFHSSIQRISPEQAGWMTGKSWHPGCPVPIGGLRVVSVSYYDFEGVPVQGQLTVNRKAASDIVSVFERLFEERFPIMNMTPRDLHPPEEVVEPMPDDTEAFNCRPVAGTDVWSQHAYGMAIDINPVQNPWVDEGKVVPRRGVPYADRSQTLPGMITETGPVVRAFADIGWEWGGHWRTLKDYMHFSANGD